MRIFGLVGIAVLTAPFLSTSAFCSPNLVQNPDFQTASTMPGVTISGGGFPSTDATGVDPHNLSGYAAAQDWLTWTWHVGERVRTRLEPSELYGPGRFMLHVQVFNSPEGDGAGGGIDQVFLAPHTGPKYANVCVLLRVVSGRAGVGLSDYGNARYVGAPVEATGQWTTLHGPNGISPVNQVLVYARSAQADFYVQSVTVTADPILPKDCVAPASRPNALPQTLVKPDPYPWTLHPEQGAPQPTQGGGDQPSPGGYYENMRPGGQPSPFESPEHDTEHGHGGDKGGGKGQPAAPNTSPSSPNTIQQQQPATNQ